MEKEKNIDILIFIEHVAREFDVVCALKTILEERYRLSVEIASIFYKLNETLEKWKPKVVGLPFCRGFDSHGVRDIAATWPSAGFVNLAFEQIFHKVNKDWRIPKDDFVKKQIIYTAWGSFFADYLIEHGVSEGNIIITGNPVLGLYNSPYRAYFDSKEKLAEQHHLTQSKKWVFIPENYKSVFFTENKLKKYIQCGAEKSEAIQYQNHEKSSLSTVIDWLITLAKENSVEIIFRPRPTTPRQKYIDLFQAVETRIPQGLHIIKSGTVREWILASDVVISSFSTSLIEAAYAEKSIFALIPEKLPPFLEQEWLERVCTLTSYSELSEMAAEPVCSVNWLKLKEWIRDHLVNGDDPICNIATVFADMHAKQMNAQQQIKPFEWSYPAEPLGVTAFHNEPHFSHEMDYFKDADVKRNTLKWSTILHNYL